MFSKLLVFQAALKIYQLSFQRLCQITSKQPQLRNCFEVYGNKTANHSRRWLMVELTAKNLQTLLQLRLGNIEGFYLSVKTALILANQTE